MRQTDRQACCTAACTGQSPWCGEHVQQHLALMTWQSAVCQKFRNSAASVVMQTPRRWPHQWRSRVGIHGLCNNELCALPSISASQPRYRVVVWTRQTKRQMADDDDQESVDGRLRDLSSCPCGTAGPSTTSDPRASMGRHPLRRNVSIRAGRGAGSASEWWDASSRSLPNVRGLVRICTDNQQPSFFVFAAPAAADCPSFPRHIGMQGAELRRRE